MINCSKSLSAVIENHVPSLEELQQVVEETLKANFKEAQIDIVDSPDISASPFNMQNKGFGKNLRVAEVGGPGNLMPKLEKNKEFNLKEICEVCELPTAGIFGPGAGPWEIVGDNCEMIADANFLTNKVGTKVVSIVEKGSKDYLLQTIDSPTFNLMANLAVFESDETTKVLHFRVSKRIGKHNMSETIRRGLAAHYREKVVSMAGLFIMKSGTAKVHVMPKFPDSERPWSDPCQVDKWLRYFNMSGPLVCATVFHSHDPGHKLRLEHTHFYSEHGDAGHYHYDITPDLVEYEGWLVPSQKIYRIDEI